VHSVSHGWELGIEGRSDLLYCKLAESSFPSTRMGRAVCVMPKRELATRPIVVGIPGGGLELQSVNSSVRKSSAYRDYSKRTSAHHVYSVTRETKCPLPFLEGLQLAFPDAQLHHLQDPNINHDRKLFVVGDFDVTLGFLRIRGLKYPDSRGLQVDRWQTLVNLNACIKKVC
jgi:hypothetical protein